MRRALLAAHSMLPALLSLFITAPVALHSDLPPDLNEALVRAISRQLGEAPEQSRHADSEGEQSAAEHARAVRRDTAAAQVMLAHFDAVKQRIEAYLFDRTANRARHFTIEVARGKLQAIMSIEALARAAFPKLERPLASLTDPDPPAPREYAAAALVAAPPAGSTFELTVELDGRPVR